MHNAASNVDFDQPVERLGSDSVKWRRFAPDVLPLWVADMDFAVPLAVQTALEERVAHGIFGYPDLPPGLKPAIMDWLELHYGWQVAAEALVLVPGVVLGFNLACHALAAPEQAVLAQPPVYGPLWKAAAATGRQEAYAPLVQEHDGQYEIDFDILEAKLQQNAGVFLLCNPHNPVGRVFRKAELERMAELCLRYEVKICSDEIHADLIFPPQQHQPLACMDPEIARHTITLMAPSKTFNIPGLGCSVAIIPDEELRQRYIRAQLGLVGHVNTLGMVAAEAAYRECGEWLESLLKYLETNRDYVVKFVNQELPGVRTNTPEGTYLAWLDCRKTGLENPQQYFLEQARVALNAGTEFGPEGRGYVRLNFACPRSTLEDALGRMKSALQSG